MRLGQLTIAGPLVFGLGLAGACHDPYVPPPTMDMAVTLPAMRWQSGAGMPLGAGRAGMPIVYAAAAQSLVGFGGSPTTETHVWSFSLRDDGWSTLIIGTAAPAGRTAHCAAYLPVQNQVLYVGGHDDSGQARPTALAFAVGTPGFSDLPGGPGAVSGCAAAWDAPHAQAVVFGGLDGNGAPTDQTWLYDAVSQTFSLASPTSRPPARSGASLVVDPAGDELSRGRVLLFGGRTADAEADDLWLWDGADWGQLGTSADPDAPSTDDPRPLGRAGAAVAVDPARRAMYLFGGERQGTLLADLWRLDLRTLTWSRLRPDGGPTGRADASVAYDPNVDRMLVFGGRGDGGPLADGWSLSPAP